MIPSSVLTPPRAVRASALALGLVLAAPAAGQAHHSFAMFDATKTVTVTGTVKQFNWTNPHVFIWVVPNPAGAAAEDQWSVELTSPGNLGRLGWTRTTLKPGDKISIDLHPLRDGAHGGGFVQLTILETGQVIKNGRSG